ncbi:hypothetical protein Q1695_000230 [Nippostrongylus brasiliensis]|nr:hypothetical protein Q1695_000230 [Nippostrongylus brasiliensis]
MILLYLCLGVVSASVLEFEPRYFTSHYDKRTLDFDDPRLFSAAFGKRNGQLRTTPNNYRLVKRFPYFGTDEAEETYEKRDMVDPRFFTNSFGKRSGFDLDDPRFSSMSFGKRSRVDFNDPRFVSMSFGKRTGIDFEDPRFLSMSFGRRR